MNNGQINEALIKILTGKLEYYLNSIKYNDPVEVSQTYSKFLQFIKDLDGKDENQEWIYPKEE